MSDAPKSAYELALEKLRKQDAERGEKAPVALNAEQKRAIAAIRARARAKLAESEILHRSDLAKAGGDEETVRRLDFRTERRRIEERSEREIGQVRSGKATSGR